MLKCNEPNCDKKAINLILIAPDEDYPLGTDWRIVPVIKRGDLFAYCNKHIDLYEHEDYIELDGQTWYGSTFTVFQVINEFKKYGITRKEIE